MFDPDTNKITYDPSNLHHDQRNAMYSLHEAQTKAGLDDDVEFNSDYGDEDCLSFHKKDAKEPSPLLRCIDHALNNPGHILQCTMRHGRKDRTTHVAYSHPICKFGTWTDTKKKLYPLFLQPPHVFYGRYDFAAFISDVVSKGICFGNQHAPKEYLSKRLEPNLKVCVIDLTNRRLASTMPATAACGLLYIAVTGGKFSLNDNPLCGVLPLFVGHMVPLMAELQAKGWEILVICEEGLLHRSCPIPNTL